MAFQVLSNTFTGCTPSYVAEKKRKFYRRSFCKYRRYSSLLLMRNDNRSLMDTSKTGTLNRAQFLQLFSLQFVTILGLDKIVDLTTISAVEKKSLTETISEGLSKILTRKEGNEEVSYKKESTSKAKSSTGMKHAEPLSEDQEETAEALIEKLRARQQLEPKR